MNATVLKEIKQLRSLTVTGLRANYREVFGEDSRSGNKAYLYRRIAWHLQSPRVTYRSERAAALWKSPTTLTCASAR